jgi:hypothetical protein
MFIRLWMDVGAVCIAGVGANPDKSGQTTILKMVFHPPMGKDKSRQANQNHW